MASSYRQIRSAGQAAPQTESEAERVRAVLAKPDAELDYARAKLAFDHIVEPAVDEAAGLAELDRMAGAARDLAGSGADEPARLNALRKLIYQSGSWNDRRPFSYDHANLFAIERKLLHTYLKTRLGNCVSMPILFLILGERLGLDLRLSCAPDHLFVRLHAANGMVLNLEPTNGAGVCRTEWVQQSFKISDRAIESGLFIRSLSRREAVAEMASTVVEHLFDMDRLDEAMRVTNVILDHSPLSCAAMLKMGSAAGILLQREFQQKYTSGFLIPVALRARCRMLMLCNQLTFARAEALGWTADPEAETEYQDYCKRKGREDVRH